MRENAKLTQDKLAEQLADQGFSYTPGAIGHWERGRYNAPLEDKSFRLALAKVLKVTEAELLTAAGYTVSNEMHSPEAIRAASIVDQMTPNQRKIAVDILERIAEG
jgi:transcriptional regulator with XRE-family HTH domain